MAGDFRGEILRFDEGFCFFDEVGAAASEDYCFRVGLGEGDCCCSADAAALSGLGRYEAWFGWGRLFLKEYLPAPVMRTTLPLADRSGLVGSIAA